MTASDRIFLRRHMSVFRQLVPRDQALTETIRQGHAWGIKQTAMAEFFGIHISRVIKGVNRQAYNMSKGHSRAKIALDLARERIRRAQLILRDAEGRERAALERIQRYS